MFRLVVAMADRVFMAMVTAVMIVDRSRGDGDLWRRWRERPSRERWQL